MNRLDFKIQIEERFDDLALPQIDACGVIATIKRSDGQMSAKL